MKEREKEGECLNGYKLQLCWQIIFKCLKQKCLVSCSCPKCCENDDYDGDDVVGSDSGQKKKRFFTFGKRGIIIGSLLSEFYSN